MIVNTDEIPKATTIESKVIINKNMDFSRRDPLYSLLWIDAEEILISTYKHMVKLFI